MDFRAQFRTQGLTQPSVYERSLEDNLDAESASQSLVFRSADTREVVMVWIEKREPRFTGE